MAVSRLSLSARWFVAIVFGLLAVSFFLSTASVLWEFRETQPDYILSAHSNLFVYFPTLGLVALAAFYVPAVIFTDLYLQGHVRGGQTRFLIGFVVVVAAAYIMSETMNSTMLRPLWEIAPKELYSDAEPRTTCRGGPELAPVGFGVDATANMIAAPDCRPSILGSTSELQRVARNRVKLSLLARECAPDVLVEKPADYTASRYCVPAHQMMSTAACCAKQNQLARQAFALWENPGKRSTAANWDRWLFLPLKCFFVIVILLIGVLLILRKRRLVARYSDLLPAMERGLQIGALAMLPWLIMDYAAQQSSDVLYGAGGGFPVRPSLVLLPWAMLLAGYFADRIQVELVRLVQLASGIISAVAILNYRSVFDLSAKVVGVGATGLHFSILCAFTLAALVYLCAWIPGALRGEDLGRLPSRPPRPVSNDERQT